MEFIMIENRKTNPYFAAFSHIGYIVEAPDLKTAKKYLFGGCFKKLIDFKKQRTSKKIHIIGNYLDIKLIDNIPDNLITFWKQKGTDWTIFMYDEVGDEYIEHIYNYDEDSMIEYVNNEYPCDDELIDIFVVLREFYDTWKYTLGPINESNKWRV